MVRRKSIMIETEVDSQTVDQLTTMDVEQMHKKRKIVEDDFEMTMRRIVRDAKNSEIQRPGEIIGDEHKLFSVKETHRYLNENDIGISLRTLCGRIERGSIPFIKVGRKRYIPKKVLEDMLATKSRYYSIRDAFQTYSKQNRNVSFRSFAGRIEKGTIPSVKFGTRRLIPVEVVESLTHIDRNYLSVNQTIDEIYKSGIGLRRNALERRLDRGRIPHEKVGGKRYIHKDVVRELIDKERVLRS
ncbi:helix-turn-helix domain-containing protein [Candidatus Micrarchaeota archaeon]|nr:helix-turn-helix domain-containing protein [Candidatus Micrarchaeota archaeon]